MYAGHMPVGPSLIVGKWYDWTRTPDGRLTTQPHVCTDCKDDHQ